MREILFRVRSSDGYELDVRAGSIVAEGVSGRINGLRGMPIGSTAFDHSLKVTYTKITMEKS